MQLPLNVWISPIYGQILIKDDCRASDVPDFSDVSGNEAVIASTQVIHVFTIPDHIGDVVVRVMREAAPQHARLIFDDVMNFSSGRVAVTTADMPLPGEAEGEAEIGVSGWVRTRVYVASSPRPTQTHLEGADRPDHVWVVLGEIPYES